MIDNWKKPSHSEKDRINLVQDFEVRYWTNKLKVSEETLRKAVAEVGSLVNDVKAWVSRNAK